MTTRARVRELRRRPGPVLRVLAHNHRHRHVVVLRVDGNHLLLVVGEAAVVREQLVATHRLVKVDITLEEEIPITN